MPNTPVRTPGTYTEWEGVVASSTQITGAVLRYGTDQNYSAGSLTRVYIPVASSHQNRLAQGILVHADQDGTLKAGAVDNAAVLASNVVTTAKILDDNITTAKILNDNITGAKILNYKTSRSNNGSTVVESAAKIVTGWTAVVVVIANATQAIAITFPTSSFTGFPIVNCTFAGDQVSGAVSATGTGQNAVVGPAGVKIHTVSSTGFTAFASAISGTWSVGNVLYFHWTAIGN